MLEIKINERNIETVTAGEDYIRGTVGAKVKITFDDFWAEYEKTIVFKRCYGGVLNEPVRVLVNDMSTVIDIPPEIIAESGKYKIGMVGIKDGVVLPTFYSEEFNAPYGTDTKGKSPDAYTPSELEQLRLLKQDKLTAGDGINIDEKNIISIDENVVSGKLDKPENIPEVGKILKVKSVNEDGTFTCEWVDTDTPVVDQTYYPESEKAQSGKAVAEAVKNVSVEATTIPTADKIPKYNQYGQLIVNCTEYVPETETAKVYSGESIPRDLWRAYINNFHERITYINNRTSTNAYGLEQLNEKTKIISSYAQTYKLDFKKSSIYVLLSSGSNNIRIMSTNGGNTAPAIDTVSEQLPDFQSGIIIIPNGITRADGGADYFQKRCLLVAITGKGTFGIPQTATKVFYYWENDKPSDVEAGLPTATAPNGVGLNMGQLSIRQLADSDISIWKI